MTNKETLKKEIDNAKEAIYIKDLRVKFLDSEIENAEKEVADTLTMKKGELQANLDNDKRYLEFLKKQ